MTGVRGRFGAARLEVRSGATAFRAVVQDFRPVPFLHESCQPRSGRLQTDALPLDEFCARPESEGTMAQRVPAGHLSLSPTMEGTVGDGAFRAERHSDLSAARAGEGPGGYAGGSGLRSGAHDLLRWLRPPPS